MTGCWFVQVADSYTYLSGQGNGNGSFRSYSRSDPGSFRSNSLSVRSFRPGSFRPDLRGGSFRPTLFYIVLR